MNRCELKHHHSAIAGDTNAISCTHVRLNYAALARVIILYYARQQQDVHKDNNSRIANLNRKRGNSECIATWGRPTPRQSSAALITTPCQVWGRSTYPLPYYSAFAADTYFTLWLCFALWPLTLNICSVWPVIWWNYVPDLSEIEQSAAELLRLQWLTWWLWTCVTWCGRLWNNFHQVWPLTTYLRCVFRCWHVISRCNLDLWLVDFESSW